MTVFAGFHAISNYFQFNHVGVHHPVATITTFYPGKAFNGHTNIPSLYIIDLDACL